VPGSAPAPFPVTAAAQVNCVVSHGGLTEHVFRAIAASIPPGEGRPVCREEHHAGSLEFPYEHPDIDGYTRDPHNPRLHHPTWPPCACRGYRITLKDRLTAITGVCHHHVAELKGQTVLSAQCQECPARVPPCERKAARSPQQIIADFLAASRAKPAPENIKAWQAGRSLAPPATPVVETVSPTGQPATAISTE
jgi:hypothetical protein